MKNWSSKLPENLPEQLTACFTSSDSMTDRLKSCADKLSEKFSLNLLDESWFDALPDDIKTSMALQENERFKFRQTHLCIAGKPFIYAQTYFPFSTLEDPRTQLAGLNAKPLGEVLFNNRSTTRSAFEYYTVTPDDELYEQAFQTLVDEEKPEELYVRRSVFHIEGHPLMVLEVFMPSFLLYCLTCTPSLEGMKRL